MLSNQWLKRPSKPSLLLRCCPRCCLTVYFLSAVEDCLILSKQHRNNPVPMLTNRLKIAHLAVDIETVSKQGRSTVSWKQDKCRPVQLHGFHVETMLTSNIASVSKRSERTVSKQYWKKTTQQYHVTRMSANLFDFMVSMWKRCWQATQHPYRNDLEEQYWNSIETRSLNRIMWIE